MSDQSWLRLNGTRFRCTPLYVPIDDLDPLERMFLDVLHQERSVSRLVKAFGLSERVVEDVLGDLIRHNRAMLVIHDGVKEIAPIEHAVPNVVHARGEVLDVWQDGSTGLVLPAWLIDPFDRPVLAVSDRGQHQPIVTLSSSSPLLENFSTAPDSQLIDMLIRADPDLWRHEQFDAELDRLADRYRVRPQTVWLPIVEANLQGRTILQIAAERLPGWIARTWSAALRREAFRDATDEIEFHAAATTDEEGKRIVHGWRPGNRLSRWREGIESLLNLLPPPVSGYDLREVRDRGSELRGLLASIGEIELCDQPRTPGDMEWLRPIFDGSSEWVILVVPTARCASYVFDWIQASATSKMNLPSKLIVVTSSDDVNTIMPAGLPQLDGASRFYPPPIRRRLPPLCPTVAIGDGFESRVQFGGGGQVIRFSGEDLTSNLLGFVQSLTTPTGPIPSEEADRNEPLRLLRVRRNSGRAMQEASVEIASSTILVRTLIDELSGFENMLLTAIVDPESLVNGDLRDKGTEPGTHSKIDRQKSLIQQLPFLVDRCDEVCHQLSLPLRPPAATWSPVSVFEYIPTLIGVLTEPSRRSVAGSLHVLTSGPSEEGFSQSILELIKHATVDRGWAVSLGFPRNTKAQPNLGGVAESLASLRSFVASPRLRLWELSTPAVVSALVMDDLVFLGIGDWMIAGLRNSTDARNCGLMIESRDFAESLRSCFTNAKEVLAFGGKA